MKMSNEIKIGQIRLRTADVAALEPLKTCKLQIYSIFHRLLLPGL